MQFEFHRIDTERNTIRSTKRLHVEKGQIRDSFIMTETEIRLKFHEMKLKFCLNVSYKVTISNVVQHQYKHCTVKLSFS